MCLVQEYYIAFFLFRNVCTEESSHNLYFFFQITWENELMSYKPQEEVSPAFYLAHIKNEKWQADASCRFVSAVSFELNPCFKG